MHVYQIYTLDTHAGYTAGLITGGDKQPSDMLMPHYGPPVASGVYTKGGGEGNF